MPTRPSLRLGVALFALGASSATVLGQTPPPVQPPVAPPIRPAAPDDAQKRVQEYLAKLRKQQENDRRLEQLRNRLAELRAKPKSPPPQSAPAVTADPDQSLFVFPHDTIFPSLILADANLPPVHVDEELRLGDGVYIAVGVHAPRAGATVEVTLSCDELMEPSTFRGVLAKGGQDYVVMPTVRWKFRELAKFDQAMPANLVCSLRVDGGAPEVQSRTIGIRSINDCPRAFRLAGSIFDTRHTYAGYVNEDHPWVQTILREALATGLVDRFTGYLIDDPDTVIAQMFAVWRAFEAHGIRYSNVATVAQADDDISSQHVRYLDQCIEEKQANCIDGTVMFASVLRKIGLDVSIALIPGHAFLAVNLSAKGTPVGFETTLLGDPNPPAVEGARQVGQELRQRQGFDEASWARFLAALRVGGQHNQDLQRHLAEPQAELPAYSVIDIGLMRRLGVRPVPFVPRVPKLVPVRR